MHYHHEDMPLTRHNTSVPLCYVYPAMLHYKACAQTRKQKIADLALMVFGLIAATYTTIQTVRVRSVFLWRIVRY